MEPEQPIDLVSLWNLAKDYLSIRLQLLRLKAVEKVSKIMADLISSLALILFVLMAFLGACVTLAFFLSELLQSFTMGFGFTALFFLLVALIILWTKDRLENKIVNLLIKRYFDKHCEEDVDENCEEEDPK